MYLSSMLSLTLAICGSDEKPFPLRTDAPPKEWQADAINNGLPYRWKKGTVHLLAWEVIEDRSDDGKTTTTNQVLVLKRFDQPIERDQHRWVLAQVYYFPNDKDRPWRRDMIHIRPAFPGEKRTMPPGAFIFGHEFYQELPTDKQIEIFLRDARWTPRLGPYQAFTMADGKVVTLNYVRTLTAGGIDPTLWKQMFGRELSTNLFPELKKVSEAKR